MTSKLKPIADQVAVITGASSGIGLVTAKAFAAKGAKVLLVARSGDVLAAIAKEIRDAGGTAEPFVADVGDEAQVEAAATRAVELFGRIDTWVNDAGAMIYAHLLDTPEDEHRKLFETNYFGVVHGCRAAVPRMAQGGAVITVASIAADMPSPIMGAYAASKHAVKAYVEVLRMELTDAGSPISVSMVKPAGVDTPVAQHAANHEGGEARIPPPVYDPAAVADAILDCAIHPRREITVGGIGRAQVLFFQHFKGLYEKLAPWAEPILIDRSSEQPKPSNLFEGGRAGAERSGKQSGMRVSLYTKAAEHPRASLLGLTAVIGAATALLFRGGRGEAS